MYLFKLVKIVIWKMSGRAGNTIFINNDFCYIIQYYKNVHGNERHFILLFFLAKM